MLYLGRIHSGVLKIGDTLWALNAAGERVGEGKVKKIFGRRGLERVEKDTAGAGEIVSIAGIKCQGNGGGGVNVTLIHPEGWGESGPQALPVRFFVLNKIKLTLTFFFFFRLPFSRPLLLIHRLFQSMYLPTTHRSLVRKEPSSPHKSSVNVSTRKPKLMLHSTFFLDLLPNLLNSAVAGFSTSASYLRLFVEKASSWVLDHPKP